MTPQANVIVEPTSEPITLERARVHLRLDAEGSPPTHFDDDLVLALITAAREQVEAYTERSVAAKTYEIRYDAWPESIELPFSPVIELVSITYIDADGLTVAIDPSYYVLDNHSCPARIATADGLDWPTAGTVPGGIRIAYRAGYEPDASPGTVSVPRSLEQAMFLMIGHWYRDREDVVDKATFELPMGSKSLMLPWRIRLGFA